MGSGFGMETGLSGKPVRGDTAVFDCHDRVAEEGCLFKVVRDMQNGNFQFPFQFLESASQVSAGGGIKG